MFRILFFFGKICSKKHYEHNCKLQAKTLSLKCVSGLRWFESGKRLSSHFGINRIRTYIVAKRRIVTVSFVILTKILPLHVEVEYMLIPESLPRIRAVPKSADLDTKCSLILGLRFNAEEALNIRQLTKLFNIYYYTNN